MQKIYSSTLIMHLFIHSNKSNKSNKTLFENERPLNGCQLLNHCFFHPATGSGSGSAIATLNFIRIVN